MRRMMCIAVAALFACGGGPSPEEQLRRAVIDFNGHVVIMKSAAELAEYRSVVEIVREKPGIVSVVPFLFVEGTLNVRGKPLTIAVKGVAPDETPVGKRITPQGVFAGYRPPAVAKAAPAPARTRTTGVTDPAPEDFAEAGDEEPLDFSGDTPRDLPPKQVLAEPVHAVIGVKLARELNLSVGDVVDFVLPPPIDYDTFRPSNQPPVRHPIRIVGMLETGAEYDERTLLTTFEALQAMVGRGDVAMGVEVHITDERAAARVASELRERLGAPPYDVIDWCELNKVALRCDL